MTNPLSGWTLDRNAIDFCGEGLARSESVVAGRDGTLWAADGRGGFTEIAPDGTQRRIAPADSRAPTGDGRSLLGNAGTPVPNGFCVVGDRFVFADIVGGAIVEMDRAGETRMILDSIDGVPLGSVNFVTTDAQGRLWITVSSRRTPADAAMTPHTRDGFIVLLDDRGPRIVADGFAFTNEARFDARGEWLYVAESCGKRISRLRVAPDGSLTDREIFGPSDLGEGFPDGIAFDAFGNLWCAMIVSERIIAITPDGDALTLFDDGDPHHVQAVEHAFARGSIPSELSVACAGPVGGLLTSINFGGPDLRTVFLGSLLGSRIPFFRSPVAGLPLAHW